MIKCCKCTTVALFLHRTVRTDNPTGLSVRAVRCKNRRVRILHPTRMIGEDELTVTRKGSGRREIAHGIPTTIHRVELIRPHPILGNTILDEWTYWYCQYLSKPQYRYCPYVLTYWSKPARHEGTARHHAAVTAAWLSSRRRWRVPGRAAPTGSPDDW